jgi:hypothetical protein
LNRARIHFSRTMPKLFNTNRLLFGIPQPNRMIYVVISLLSVLLFGGIIFGWSQLQVSFEREGYFANQCSDALIADINNVDKSTDKPTQSPRAAYLQRSIPCADLNSQFGEIFFVGCIAATIVPVVIGPIQDRLSNMWARVFAACMVSSGLISISFAGKESMFLVKLGAALLGAGGNGFQLTSFPMAVLFPGNEGLVSSLCTGFFSLSSLVFFAIQFLQRNYDLSLSVCLLYYAYVSAAFLLLSLVWPHNFSHDGEGSDVVPAVVQDEAGSSMRISARQSFRRSRAMSCKRNSSITEGRSSFSAFSQPFDSIDLNAARTGPRRTTFHSIDAAKLSKTDRRVPESTNEVQPLIVAALHQQALDGVQIDAPKPTPERCPDASVESDPSLLPTQNEEISKKLQLSSMSGLQQLRSREYLALVINFLVGSLVSDFYIGSYLEQTRRLPQKCSAGSTLVECDAQQLDLFQTAWSSIYPCGAIASPLFGMAMDRLQFRHVFVVCILVSICHQATNLVPIINLQFVTYVVFACGRQVIFGFFYSSLGILFGFRHYGLLTSASAVFVATLIYTNKLLVDASERANSYFLVNVTFLALTVSLLPLKLAFTWSSKRLEGVHENLLPH